MKFWLLLFALPLFAQKSHELCFSCHSEHVDDFKTHTHFSKGLSCDACHGKSEKHIQAAGAAAPDRVAAPDELSKLCGACHVSQRKEFEQSRHFLTKARSANCETCHGVHAIRPAVVVLRQCQRCHASLPESCKRTTAGNSCMSCHQKHLLAAKR